MSAQRNKLIEAAILIGQDAGLIDSIKPAGLQCALLRLKAEGIRVVVLDDYV